MPNTAASLIQLKNFNDPIERALYAAFTALGGKPILTRAADEAADEVWIVPTFQRGPAEGHFFKRPDGRYDYDIFRDCVIEWNLSVPRVGDKRISQALLVETYSLFSQEVARIELSMDPARFDFLNAQMPFHKLTRVKPLGSNQGFDEATAEDRAQVRFGCMVGIKPDAWPTDPQAYVDLIG